jgi:hypothetical protein
LFPLIHLGKDPPAAGETTRVPAPASRPPGRRPDPEPTGPLVAAGETTRVPAPAPASRPPGRRPDPEPAGPTAAYVGTVSEFSPPHVPMRRYVLTPLT